MNIEHITLLVRDYEEAIDFYTRIMQFVLLEDTLIASDKRWVLVSPDKLVKTSLLLVKVINDKQEILVGNQTGDSVFLFLSTENLESFYEHLLINKVSIVNKPIVEAWGKILKFRDLYGNIIELIQPNE